MVIAEAFDEEMFVNFESSKAIVLFGLLPACHRAEYHLVVP